jgi:hypothetical protein
MQTQFSSWQIPVLGQPAAEPLPQWIIDRLVDGSMRINSLGGFTMTDPFDLRSSVGGETVVLREDSTIEFWEQVALAA